MKSHPLRLLAGAGAAIALVAALSGCSGDGGAGGTATLEFQTAQAVDSPLYASLKRITARFEKAHPDIRIDLKTGDDSYESQMKVRLAAHNPPDLWATHGWSLLRYSAFLQPLNDQPWAKHFNPVLAPAMKDKQGRFFALPVTTSASGLVINTSVLEKAGVDPSTLGTWAGLQRAAQKVKASGAVPFYLAGSKDGSSGNVIDWLAPGAFDTAELAGFASGKFQTGPYQDLLGVVEKMRTDGWVNPDYTSATFDDMARAFAQGKSAFALTSNFLINSAWKYDPDAKLTYVPIPAIDGSKPYLIGGEDTAFGADRTGSHLQQAEEYLAFLAQPANISAMADAVGNPPGLTNAKADLGALTAPYKEYVASNAVPLRPFFDRVSLPNGMWETVVSTSDGVIAGQSSPSEGTAKMAADFATLYKPSK